MEKDASKSRQKLPLVANEVAGLGAEDKSLRRIKENEIRGPCGLFRW